MKPLAIRVRECVARIDCEFGVSVATVVFAWLLALPCWSLPIVGSSRIAALSDAVDATRGSNCCVLRRRALIDRPLNATVT
ncbi:hypothetical protein WS72_19000 [Burkholderia savannae]|uniref:Uncharacterized protein n=1 Tax=Burkholderia savannae TaxID=1637837 RepID=A0ABR5T9Z3_9BURK|nr:hypothetical protein [Burkholderia savannae]KWZ39944.1 hypothetical protein WS72_19000 [Burkholderia savannae]